MAVQLARVSLAPAFRRGGWNILLTDGGRGQRRNA